MTLPPFPNPLVAVQFGFFASTIIRIYLFNSYYDSLYLYYGLDCSLHLYRSLYDSLHLYYGLDYSLYSGHQNIDNV